MLDTIRVQSIEQNAYFVNSANVLSATTEKNSYYTIKLAITIDSVMDHLKYRFVASYYRYIRNCLQRDSAISE